MFSPEMLAAAQKMMENMTPEQMSQIAGMASKMNPDMLKGLNGGNAGMPMPTASQFEEAKEKMKNMSSDDMKNMFNSATNRLSGQNAYMVNGATLLKNEGNDKVRNGDYSGAIGIFEKALSNLSSCPAPDHSIQDISQSIKLNMALCFLKLSRYEDCVLICDSILEVDSRSIKALYRRGVAKRETGETFEGAKDIKLSMLLSDQKDNVINSEFEKTLSMVSDVKELTELDLVTLDSLQKPLQEARPSVGSAAESNLSKAKEIIETNPDVIDRMGDVISQLDDNELDGILSMSAAGSGVGAGVDLGEMKKILKNKDFMKSMTEMMKNMDPSTIENLTKANAGIGGSSSSTSEGGQPDMTKIMSDPSMLKSVESMVDSVPDEILEEMLLKGAGSQPSLPSFVTGARMKWVVKRIMVLVRFWIMFKRFLSIVLSRNGKIVIAIVVILVGLYQKYGHLIFHKEEDKPKSVTEL
jgi:tetratricopeptide (TPR) repeat protein